MKPFSFSTLTKTAFSLLTITLSALLTAFAAQAADPTIHHKVELRLDPTTSTMHAVDVVTVDKSLTGGELIFRVNSDLTLKSLSNDIVLEMVEEDANAPDVGIDRDNDSLKSVIRVNAYRIKNAPKGKDFSFSVELSGTINYPITQMGQQYDRGFSQTPGIIEERGAYLAGSTYWIPHFQEQLITYDLDVVSPKGWRSVSQGRRDLAEAQGETHRDRWVVNTATEEIYVIAAAFAEYDYDVGAVKAMAFLREADDNMAQTYLETTAQYLEMYRSILGPYPYSKFALVENFWETGYGMPSFTLLGQQIIRFPFILHSSYPHELLHNWWGNGVFVDFDTGNWCEGLTAYMADHLVAEQRGQGADYRRSILQRYTDFVDDKNDFPLSQFASRLNPAMEAVGYGKSAMTWNMLRDKVGDEMFLRGFQTFYRENKFSQAGFDDIRQSFEKVSGQDLKSFFDQWVKKKGAPELELRNTKVKKKGKGYSVDFTLAQIQSGKAYNIDVPVAIYTKDKAKIEKVAMSKKSQKFSIAVDGEPIRVAVDPEFDLFRRLNYKEIPPALSKAFGADKVVILLPSEADESKKKRYQTLADQWAAERGGKVKVALDSDYTSLPKDAAVWVLGADNRFASIITGAMSGYDAELGAETARFGGTEYAMADNSVIVAVRHPENTDLAVVYLTVDRDDTVPGLAGKLPHYGKYSYLVFTGEEPTNVGKGQWPAYDSPLLAMLSKEVPTVSHAKRPALAQLAPVFSSENMMKHVTYLASDELQGRGVGTEGIELAAQYIADQLKAAGLEPGGDNGTYFQTLTMKAGDEQKEVTTKNVVAVLPGSEKGWAEQSVILGAHYDHLGLGWPDVRADNVGKIHNGADDNASGVAVMLELAKNLKQNLKPKRSIVFIAFTAEESGLVGARHYVQNAKLPADKAIGVVNLDTVGNLGEQKLLIFGGPSAREWPFIFMGASAVTGVETEVVTNVVNASDHVAFAEIGVPGVQLSSGASTTYHKPNDTVDKVDSNGLVKVAAIAREVVQYLAEREEAMPFQGERPNANNAPQQSSERKPRRASTGTIPDFAFAGKGVRLGGVTDGSPAVAAGLQKGDVITGLAGQEVDGLQAFTNILKDHKPGDTVDVVYLRDGESHKAQLTLGER